MQLTYQQAYDKIIDAYFKDEIRPYHDNFCLCGTLAIGFWNRPLHCDYTKEPYSKTEYARMESELLIALGNKPRGKKMFHWCGDGDGVNGRLTERYEDKLFKGMSAALDVLKEIHRSRGEDVDNISQPFTKRQLA